METDRKDFMRIDYETIERLLKSIRELRKEFVYKNKPLKTASNSYLIVRALEVYKRSEEKILRNKEKKKNKGVLKNE